MLWRFYHVKGYFICSTIVFIIDTHNRDYLSTYSLFLAINLSLFLFAGCNPSSQLSPLLCDRKIDITESKFNSSTVSTLSLHSSKFLQTNYVQEGEIKTVECSWPNSKRVQQQQSKLENGINMFNFTQPTLAISPLVVCHQGLLVKFTW